MRKDFLDARKALPLMHLTTRPLRKDFVRAAQGFGQKSDEMHAWGDPCARVSSRPRKGLDGKDMTWLHEEPLRKDFVKAAQGFSPTILSMARSGTTLYILHCPTLRKKAQGAQGFCLGAQGF